MLLTSLRTQDIKCDRVNIFHSSNPFCSLRDLDKYIGGCNILVGNRTGEEDVRCEVLLMLPDRFLPEL